MLVVSDFLEPQPGDVVLALPASAIPALWQFLRAEVQRREIDGGQVRPDVQRSVAILRSAASSSLAMSATGPDSRTSADMAPISELLGTAAAADAFGCSPRHLRRVALAEGVGPVARGAWRRSDIEELRRRKATS